MKYVRNSFIKEVGYKGTEKGKTSSPRTSCSQDGDGIYLRDAKNDDVYDKHGIPILCQPQA